MMINCNRLFFVTKLVMTKNQWLMITGFIGYKFQKMVLEDSDARII